MIGVPAVETEQKIRLIVADDHPLIRSGIRMMLANHPQYMLVKEGTCGEQAIEYCREFQPDVLVLDLDMPGPSSVQIVSTLRVECHNLKVVILTEDDTDQQIRQLIALGVQGYVLKDEDLETLLNAIWTVQQGGLWFSEAISERMRSWLVNHSDTEMELLSCRELEVLQQMAQGRTNEEISEQLGISERTTRYHAEQIRQKLQADNRTEAVVKALKLGLIKV